MDTNEHSATKPQLQALECADLSALSAGDLSPPNEEDSGLRRRAAERGPALATSRQSGQGGDESPHSKSVLFVREV